MEDLTLVLQSKIQLTIGDKLKEINCLIKSLHEKNKTQEVEQFISSFHPSTSFEKLILVRLIDSFKLSSELVQVFFSEDLFLIDQALKCQWFFKDEVNYLKNPEEFIEKFISKLSWSTRGKVLKNYGRKLSDSSKANNLFKLLLDLYGFKEAFKLLPVCSKEYVNNVIDNVTVELPAETVDQLYLYCPKLAVSYLYKYFDRRNQTGFYSCITYDNLLLKLASKETNVFIDLFNKYGKTIHLDKLGKGLTRKLLKSDYGSILKHADLYVSLLKMKLVVPCLSFSQIEELHLALMPSSLNELKRSFNTHGFYQPEYIKMLSFVNKKIAEEILVKNVQLKFGKDVLQDPSLMNESFAGLVPKEMRIKWAEKRLNDPKVADSDKIISAGFLEPQASFPLLKSMVSSALDFNTRRDIVKSMLQSVRVYGCFSELSQVFSFVLNRLRNDATAVKEVLFEEAIKNDLTQLTIDQWGPIIELIKLMTINDELDSFSRGMVVTIYHKWIQRRLVAGLTVDSELKTVLKMVSNYYSFSASSIGPNYEHFYLNWFNENLETKDFANDSEKNSMAINLFKSLITWNKRHPNQKIVYKDWILSVVKVKMESSYSRSEILRSLKKDVHLRHSIFDSIFPLICLPEILLYKLKSDVPSVLNCLDDLFEKIIDDDVAVYRLFFNRVRLFSSADLPQRFAQLCVKAVHSEENTVSNKRRSIQVLSFIAEPQEFLSLIETFYPSDGKPNLEFDGAHDLLRLQQSIASNMKNINPPSAMIESIKKFAHGDYLKLSLGSLLSILLRTPQDKAILFLKNNLETPVSYRKHILRLFHMIAPIKMTCQILVTPLMTETNVSIRVLLWGIIYKILSKEKTSVAWLTLKEAFNYLKEDDLKHISKLIFNGREIPKEFLVEYIMMVWQKVEAYKNAPDMKQKIFDLVTIKTIPLLSEDFCDVLLDFTYSIDEDSGTWPEFIALYLCCSKQEFIESRISKVLSKMKSVVLPKWEIKCEDFSFKFQDRLSNMIESLCQKTCLPDFPCDAVRILSQFQTGLLDVLPESEILADNFMLNLYIAHHQSNESDHLIGFINKLCCLTDKIYSCYGSLSLNILCPVVKDFVNQHVNIKEENSLLNISYHILCNDFSDLNKILALELLPSYVNENKKEAILSKYETIYKLMKNHTKLELKTYALQRAFKST